MADKIKNIYSRWKNIIFMVPAFAVPFVIYVLTLERKLIGGDTTWYALQIPEMSIMVPTGYPTFSLLLKLFTFLPFGDLAYRLNFFSAFFGGLTILFLFLTINKLIKNEVLSLAGSLIFSFLFPYWFIANRLEFDTLNSFFIVLVLYSAVLYSGIKKRKYLYFFFFCLGLSLTNHPIAFFVVPAILLYIIIENPKIFKSIKAIFISILYFILPLLSYFYLLIRSRQGHGPVTDLIKLFYYVTGRKVSGTIHGGTFFDQSFEHVLGVMRDYLLMIYNNFGLILMIIAAAGLIYLIKKNWKLGLCLLLFIGFNILVPPLYLPFANDNYIIDSLIIIAIFISFGFLLIYNGSLRLFEKAAMGKKSIKTDRVLKYFLIASILMTSLAFPAFQAVYTYKEHDRSEPSSIYKFWDQAFKNMEDGSSIYVHAASENVGVFLNRYEYPEKDIDYYYSRSEEYSVENAIADFENGRDVYFVGKEALFKLMFNTEKKGGTFLVKRYGEYLRLYKAVSVFKSLEIGYDLDDKVKGFGEKFQIEFTVENKNNEPVQIRSIELDLPDNIDFVDVDPNGYIGQGPGMSRGIYMWVSDEYYVDAEGRINLIVELQGTGPGIGEIKFRITTHDVYIEADLIEIEIK